MLFLLSVALAYIIYNIYRTIHCVYISNRNNICIINNNVNITAIVFATGIRGDSGGYATVEEYLSLVNGYDSGFA